MDEIHYLISDASKKVDVETHVLRYWEDELGLSIPRNEMGHRYYTEFHIRLFCQVKELKDKGYQLKAIKAALKQVMERNQEVIKTADVLEQDISNTLQDNPRLGLLYRISVDKPGKTKEVVEHIFRDEPTNITRMSDYSRLEPETKRTEKEPEPVQSGSAAVTQKAESQSQEIEKEDGQTEMKNRKKNPKKPSAWERRNGVVVSRKTESFYKELQKAAQKKTQVEPQKAQGEASQDGQQEEPQIKAAEELQAGLQKGTQKCVEEKRSAKLQEDELQENELQENESQEEPMLPQALQPEPAGESPEMEAQAALPEPGGQGEFSLMTREEKMEQFQMIMNHIIGQALEANNEKLSRDISVLVNQKISEDLQDLMRIRDEREEERFRQLDELIRSCQRESLSKAEAAAAKIPFFRKKCFSRNQLK